MTSVLIAWFVLILVFAGITSFVVFQKGEFSKRALVSFLIAVPVTFASLVATTGQSMPCVAGLTAPTGRFPIRTYIPLPGDKIHLILSLGHDTYRMCYIPWSPKDANQLERSDGSSSELVIDLDGSTVEESRVRDDPPKEPENE